MRYTIEHRGIPVGRVELVDGSRDRVLTAPVALLPGFALVREALAARRAAGPAPEAERPALDLRDERGLAVPGAAVDLQVLPSRRDEVLAWVAFPRAGAPVPAARAPAPWADGSVPPPDA